MKFLDNILVKNYNQIMFVLMGFNLLSVGTLDLFKNLLSDDTSYILLAINILFMYTVISVGKSWYPKIKELDVEKP